MSKKIVLVFIVLFIFACKAKQEVPENLNLLDRLKALPDVTVNEIEPIHHYNRVFEINVTQPIDHDNPNSETFTQRVYLSHVDESRPTILTPDGGGVTKNRTLELTRILNANQVYIAHRFYQGAEPDTMDWQYLNIKQTAADYHKIVGLFKQIYNGKWLSSSISKGGTETMIHRYFYPNDITTTVAYVAPITLSDEDPRIDRFLVEEVGTAACRQKIMQFQRRLLEKREDLIPVVQSLCEETGKTFSLDYDLIFEYHVLEYIFIFWQWGPGDCNAIPEADASIKEMHDHLLDIVGAYDFYSDEEIAISVPIYYEDYTQFGYYGYIVDHLHDLLVASPENPTNRIFLPDDVELIFDPVPMRNLLNWVQNEGNNIILLYGGQDPWTACAVELTGSTNAVKIVVPGVNHGLRISDLSDADRELVLSTLEEWLDISIER